MRFRQPAGAVVLSVLALAGCGSSKSKDVNAATYTCADFNKSLKAKGDDSAGNYINQLRKQANLGRDAKTERNALTLGIYFACRGKPGSTKPAAAAVTTAKLIKAGKFHIPGKKKSTH
jgi:hypothetical protein